MSRKATLELTQWVAWIVQHDRLSFLTSTLPLQQLGHGIESGPEVPQRKHWTSGLRTHRNHGAGCDEGVRAVRSSRGGIREASRGWPHEGAGLHQGSRRLLDRDLQRFHGGIDVEKIVFSGRESAILVETIRREGRNDRVLYCFHGYTGRRKYCLILIRFRHDFD